MINKPRPQPTASLHTKGGIWEQLHISATSDAIGVREGRRIHGLYTLTKEDVYAGRQFSDGICSVAFGTDLHFERVK